MSREYKFYETGDKRVICVADYHGKRIRKVAKCSEKDSYDFNKGCELARARVEYEIAQRRLSEANKELFKLCDEKLSLERKITKAKKRVHTAWDLFGGAKSFLLDTEEKF